MSARSNCVPYCFEMSDGSYTPPGWYYAAGDPPGTQRYWDGELWQGQPVPLPPTAAPPYGYRSYPESSQATIALVCSIAGFVLCGLLAPVGWYLANQEIAGIDAGRRDPAHRGMANAARIIGAILTVLMILAVVLIVVIIIASASATS